MSQKLRDYDYPLPEELIAKRPLPQRDESRMMVLHRDSETIEHRKFRDLKTFSRPDDLLVLNNTRVLAARRFSDDHAVEFLFLEKLGTARWKCLVKPGRKLRIGAATKIDNVSLRVEEILLDGERVVALDEDVDLYAHGSMPLPPYMRRESDLGDGDRYQTVFAQTPGALAAPTAGLHFTPENITEHRMHAESFSISDEAAKKINNAKRIIAVGTTTVRVLESARRENGKLLPQNGSTDLFVYPPFNFQLGGALLTNFHLPRSTLLMLVSAFAGREFLLRAYAEAIRERYRFYSYGDCMLIL